MTCAKRIVTCKIVTESGKFYGTNDCRNPQASCPRLPGEDYTKCKEICDQEGHAEIMALKAAGEHAIGGYAVIYGIGHVCRCCQEEMVKAGLRWFNIAPTMHPLNSVVHPIFNEGESK